MHVHAFSNILKKAYVFHYFWDVEDSMFVLFSVFVRFVFCIDFWLLFGTNLVSFGVLWGGFWEPKSVIFGIDFGIKFPICVSMCALGV